MSTKKKAAVSVRIDSELLERARAAIDWMAKQKVFSEDPVRFAKVAKILQRTKLPRDLTLTDWIEDGLEGLVTFVEKLFRLPWAIHDGPVPEAQLPRRRGGKKKQPLAEPKAPSAPLKPRYAKRRRTIRKLIDDEV